MGKKANVLLRYSGNNKSAGVVYNGDYQSLILGFSFESLETKGVQKRIDETDALIF